MHYLHHLLTIASILLLATLVRAGDKQDGKPGQVGKPGHGCRAVKCPQCCHDCVFSAEKSKKKESCYDVECEPICIPRVLFPWQKGCCSCGKGGGKDGCCAVHNGVKKRSVRVLKKYEYECSECKYKWTVVGDKDEFHGNDVKDKTIATEPAQATDLPVPPLPSVSAVHRS